jgi:hypothetical protein
MIRSCGQTNTWKGALARSCVLSWETILCHTFHEIHCNVGRKYWHALWRAPPQNTKAMIKLNYHNYHNRSTLKRHYQQLSAHNGVS